MYTNQILLFVFFVLLLVFFYKRQSCGKSTCVSYYFSPHCPHCRNFTLEWNKFKKMAKHCTFKEIDCTREPEKCSGIRGVPHIVFTSSSGDELVYEGKRDSNSLYKFSKSKMLSQ